MATGWKTHFETFPRMWRCEPAVSWARDRAGLRVMRDPAKACETLCRDRRGTLRPDPAFNNVRAPWRVFRKMRALCDRGFGLCDVDANVYSSAKDVYGWAVEAGGRRHIRRPPLPRNARRSRRVDELSTLLNKVVPCYLAGQAVHDRGRLSDPPRPAQECKTAEHIVADQEHALSDGSSNPRPGRAATAAGVVEHVRQ